HNNLRTSIIKFRLGVKSHSFNKLNIQKWLLTTFKINKLPDIHIVDRYLATTQSLGIKNDGKGLDYFIPKNDEVSAVDFFESQKYIALVLGAKFKTKQMPLDKLVEICDKLKNPIVLLGGKDDRRLGEEIVEKSKNTQLYNASGQYNLNQSASILAQAEKVITHDTGLMHIAAALQKDIISIWGNTVPELGMYPYVTQEKYKIVEVKNLSCRPCSKIGYNKCPKGHFDCMKKINVEEMLA
ncbi:MAG: glycosyltransferase family 9 protein, partial [Chitinophagales bacterium]